MAVTVENGVNHLSAELGDKTVGEIRSMLRQALNIDPRAAAYVNGNSADADTMVADGDEVEFVKAAGTKGN